VKKYLLAILSATIFFNCVSSAGSLLSLRLSKKQFMRRSLLFLAITALPILLFAQKPITGAIRGNVYDKETAQPVGFATIRVEGQNLGTISDINGFYSIANIPVGTYQISVSLTGYDLYETEVVVKKADTLGRIRTAGSGRTRKISCACIRRSSLSFSGSPGRQ